MEDNGISELCFRAFRKGGIEMFKFINKDKKSKKLFKNCQKILSKEAEIAKNNELLIGINPDTYL